MRYNMGMKTKTMPSANGAAPILIEKILDSEPIVFRQPERSGDSLSRRATAALIVNC